MQKYAELGYKALALQAYARLDFILDKEGNMYCLEANTLPGMTATSRYPRMMGQAGITFEMILDTLIDEALRRSATWTA